MNRLQKKCLIAATGTHLLVVVAVLCSGFAWSNKPKEDNTQVLDVIPSKLIDAMFSSGVKGATPPPPTPPPPLVPPQPPPPTPEPPKPIVKPPPEPVRPPEPVTPPDDKSLEPTPKPPKKEHKIEVDLTKKIVRKTPVKDDTAEKAEQERAEREAQKAAQKARDARAKAFRSAATSIRNNTSPSMTVDMPGDSTVAYASYASVVKTVYTQAWQPPANADNDDADVVVSVTIANTGRVISAHIIDRSGDSGLDRSIQNTLDRVTELPPFPDGASDKERTYKIRFNLKAKRMLG